MKTYDVVRIDHFRGLDRYYSIKADAENARAGEWLDGPKKELFEAAEERLGELPLIAEDLGVMDDGVKKLLKDCGYPGMKILLFAFDGDGENVMLPENIGENGVCYTGTHDNDTIAGYLKRINKEERIKLVKSMRKSLKNRKMTARLVTDEDIVKAMVALAMESDADYAIVPVQDILGLDNSARMNSPGTIGDNWTFRLASLPKEEDMSYLKRLIIKYDRA